MNTAKWWKVENLHSPGADRENFALLVYTHTTQYPHDSIPDALRAFQELGKEHGFTVVGSADPIMFREATLQRFSALVFVNTSGDVLDEEGKRALQRFVRSGGGFIGVHGAAATLEEWDWYVDLIGATFKSHPPIQRASVRTIDRSHPSTQHLPEIWEWTDEWYNFRSLPGQATILLTVDEETYEGGEHGKWHPVAWCREFEGGRVFYTAIGHQREAFEHPMIRRHLLGAIRSVTGSRSRTGKPPRVSGGDATG